MQPLNRDILDAMATWPDAAQHQLMTIRTILHDVAADADTGPLDENLKWGQPAWRPHRLRTGTTLRLGWSPEMPSEINAFVDCKTDLAGQMELRFPDSCDTDGRRRLCFPTGQEINRDAMWTLAWLTFTYHRAKRRG